MRTAAKRCKIPFSTLQERIKKDKFVTPVLGRKTIFTKEQELEMSNQIKYLASIFYGCTDKEVRRMAFQFAERNNIKHNFNTELKNGQKFGQIIGLQHPTKNRQKVRNKVAFQTINAP